MISRVLLTLVAGMLLSSCALNDGLSPTMVNDSGQVVRTYTYYDANHPDGNSGQASPQAIYNINHGTWLWPPAISNNRIR